MIVSEAIITAAMSKVSHVYPSVAHDTSRQMMIRAAKSFPWGNFLLVGLRKLCVTRSDSNSPKRRPTRDPNAKMLSVTMNSNILHGLTLVIPPGHVP